MTKIAAAIVTYNRKALLIECIQALLNQTYPVDEIYVVDNCSTDGTQELLKENNLLTNKKIKYKKMDSNTGCSWGFNTAVKQALLGKPDWIWLMDDDAIVDKNALKEMVNSKQFKNPKTGLLAPKVVDSKKKIQPVSMESVIINEKTFRHKTLTPDDWKKESFQVGSFQLLGILVRESIIKEVGNVNREFFIECDDLDFTLRISDKYKMYVITKSILVHKSNPSSSLIIKPFGTEHAILTAPNLWKEYYAIRNYVYILRKRKLFDTFQMLKLIKRFGSIAFVDHKPLRTKIFMMALQDGLHDTLGKRLDPATFKQEYIEKNA